jgi:hypothetical protein
MTPGSAANEARTAKPADRERGVGARGGPVVTPITRAGTLRAHRSIEERFIVSFPGSYRAATALLLGLVRPQTRARRRFLRHAVVSGWAAVQRRDFELMLVRYAPSVVFDADAGLQALGVPGSARGRAEMASVLAEILDVFDRFELAPALVVDLGNCLIVLGASRVHGQGSGIELETQVAQLLTLERGLVVRERDFFRWDDALRAAALDPAALKLPG